MKAVIEEKISSERVELIRYGLQTRIDAGASSAPDLDRDIAGALTELQQRRAADDTHRCFICNEPFQAGQMVLPDVNEGLAHRECFGKDREAYVKDTDTGEPLGPDDPIPAGEPYDPEDFAPAQRRPLVVKPLEWGETSYGSPEAITVVGIYRINSAWNGGWSAVIKGDVLRDTDGRENFATVESAKAAAQADYERRILSALYTTEGG